MFDSLKDKIFPPKKSAPEGESHLSKSDDDPKKSSMLLKVVIVLGLAYLAADHFLLSNPAQNSEEELFKNAPKPKKKNLKKLNVDSEIQSANEKLNINEKNVMIKNDQKNDEGIISETSSEKTVLENLPVENVNLLTNKNEINSEEIVEKLSEEVSKNSDTPKENSVEVKNESLVPEVKFSVPDQISSDSSVEVIDVNKSLNESLLDKSNSEKNDIDFSAKLINAVKNENVYVSPPLYDLVGRGLVYNCRGKHWACVDKASYQNCHKNMTYNKEYNKKMECVIVNVYKTDEDCSTVQNYNVTHSTNTDFCL